MKLQCIDCFAYLAIRNRSGKAGLGKGTVILLGTYNKRAKSSWFQGILIIETQNIFLNVSNIPTPLLPPASENGNRKGGSITCDPALLPRHRLAVSCKLQRPSTFPSNPPSLDPPLSAQLRTNLTLKISSMQQSTANRHHAMEGTRGTKWQERSITRRSLRSGLIDLPIRDARQSR
jgi:hypothetical protein